METRTLSVISYLLIDESFPYPWNGVYHGGCPINITAMVVIVFPQLRLHVV